MSEIQTYLDQKHLNLPSDFDFAGGPPGPEIEIIDTSPQFDQPGFIIWTGIGSLSLEEIQRLQEAFGHQHGVSPVSIDIEQEALFKWGEALIQSAVREVTTKLVKALDMYDKEEGFVGGRSLYKKIRKGMASIIPVLDQDGEHITVLELFNNNVEACTAALYAGLYFLIMDEIDDKTKQNQMAAVFETVSQRLELSQSSFELALQIMDKSNMLHEWLTPCGALSMRQTVMGVLQNPEARKQFLPQFEQAAAGLLNDNFRSGLSDLGVIPTGQLELTTELSVPQDQALFAVYDLLSTNSVAALEFLLYLMNYQSHARLQEYIDYRFGYQLPGPVPLFELEDEVEITNDN